MMKGFLLSVNILELMPFLCLESDERWFCQKAVKYVPNNYVLKSYYCYEPNYYQRRPAVPINNPYTLHLYPVKLVAVRSHTQIPQWQVPSNIYPSPLAHHKYLKPSFIVIPPTKIQDKPIIPPFDTITTIEATHSPTIEPTVNTVVPPEASSEVIVTNTPESTTVPVISSQV
ncbi:LOW QUALITY PROTEIN: kappa-casein [Trichechus inunguis]